MSRLVIFAFLFLCLLSGAAHADAVKDRVLKEGVLRCAFASGNPYSYKNLETGKVEGFVAEIAEAMADQLGLKIDWVAEVGYADFADGLETGRYDAFCGILGVIAPRARVAAFTNPYGYMPYYVHVRADETRFSSLEDMNKPDIVAGSTDGEAFQRITRELLPLAKEKSLVNMTPVGQLYLELAEGKVDVVVHDTLAAEVYNKSGAKKIKRAWDSPLKTSPMGFAVKSDALELRDMMNVALLNLNDLGVIDRILTKHGVDSKEIYRLKPLYETPK